MDEFHAVLDKIKKDGTYVRRSTWAPPTSGRPRPWASRTSARTTGRARRPQGADRRQGEVHRPAICRTCSRSWPTGRPTWATAIQAQKYPDSQNLFSLGKAAIYPAGSWDITTFRRRRRKFPIGAFPPPLPRRRRPCYISDHTDIGMGINAASKNMDAAKKFLDGWRRRNSRRIYANALPGFFPLSKAPVTIKDHGRRRRWSAGARAASRRSATRTRSCRAARRTWRTSSGTSRRRSINGTMTPEAAGQAAPGRPRQVVQARRSKAMTPNRCQSRAVPRAPSPAAGEANASPARERERSSAAPT